MTAVAPAIDAAALLVQQEREDGERLQVLRTWLLGLGVCPICALGFALAAVERERMRAPVEPPCCTRVVVPEAKTWADWRPDDKHVLRSCADIARGEWMKRPRRAA